MKIKQKLHAFKELKAKHFGEYSGELVVQNNASFIAW